MSDTHHEVLVVIITGAILFLVLTSIVTFISVYYQKKRFQHQQELLDKEKEYHQQLLQAQLEMQEQTFNMISQEIHDNVGQSLSLAKVQLHILEQGNTLNKSLLVETKDSVSKALTDLRDIAKSLNSERIQQFSLHEIIAQELSRLNRSGLLLTNLQIEGNKKEIESQKKLILFRIVQEAFQNILKHAAARNVDVCCRYGEKHLQLEVSDNGKGFNTNLLNAKDGLGLSNMVNRAALIGGKAQVDSVISKGTTIIITLPYE